MESKTAESSYWKRSRNLLESTASLLGVHLEIWTEPQGPVSSHRTPVTCITCGRTDSDLFQECMRLRWSRSLKAVERNEAVAWDCPKGLRLLSLPIRSRPERARALVSVDLAPDSPGPPEVEERPNAGSPDPSPMDGAVYGELNPGVLVGRPLRESTEEPARAGLSFPELGTARSQSSPIPERKQAFLTDLARLLGDQIDMIGELNAARSDLFTRHEELNMLYNISGRLTDHENLRQNLGQMLEQARATLCADAGILGIRGRRIEQVALRPGLADEEQLDARVWKRLGTALTQGIAAAGQSEFSGSLSEIPGASGLLPRPARLLAAAIRVEGQPAGIIALLKLGAAAGFRSGDRKLIGSLAEQIGMLVSRSELYEDLRDFLMATVKSLVSAIEAKDRYTSGHSERVNLISMLLGKAMRLPPDELETLRWASILHDVGKIGMPECILLKPGRLTREEYEVMKTHPARGYQVLAPIRQLATASLGVEAHHEMFNGKGYPRGVAGKEIPRIARIIAVADTFDALTTTRPYREAQTLDFALWEIQRVRGQQLDAEVVDCFAELMPFLKEHHIMIHAASESLGGREVA
jgi:hypothetical protein